MRPGAQATAQAGAGGAAMSGVAQPSGGKPSDDAQKTVMAIAQNIKKANPQIDPGTLFQAVTQQIATMKGVEPEIKDYMNLQIKAAEMTTKLQEAQAKIDGLERRQGMRDDTQEDVQDKKNKGGLAIQDDRNKGGLAVQGSRNAGNLATQGERNAGGLAIQGERNAGNLAVAGENAGSREEVARTGYKGKVDSARAGQGKEPLFYLDEKGNRVAAGGAPNAPSGGGAYKSAEDVRAAYKAGKLKKDAAVKILQDQFGHQ